MFDLIFLAYIENAYGKKLTADCIGGLGSRYLAWYSTLLLIWTSRQILFQSLPARAKSEVNLLVSKLVAALR